MARFGQELNKQLRDAQDSLDNIKEDIAGEVEHLSKMLSHHSETMNESGQVLEGVDAFMDEVTSQLAKIRKLRHDAAVLEGGVRVLECALKHM